MSKRKRAEEEKTKDNQEEVKSKRLKRKHKEKEATHEGEKSAKHASVEISRDGTGPTENKSKRKRGKTRRRHRTGEALQGGAQLNNVETLEEPDKPVEKLSSPEDDSAVGHSIPKPERKQGKARNEDRATEPLENAIKSAEHKSESRRGKKRKRNGPKDTLEDGTQSSKAKTSREPGKHIKGPSSGDDAPAVSRDAAALQISKKHKTQKQKHKREEGLGPVNAPGSSWIAQPAVGGLQLDLDPVFAVDEEHILLAYHDSIRVYATATSLLVRSLRLKKTPKISSFHLSRSDPAQLYICFDEGHFQLWNWHKGTWLQSWDIKSQILDSGCGLLNAAETDQSDVLISIDEHDGKRMITAHQLQGMPGAQESIQKTLYRTEQPISMLWVSSDARCIVAAGGQRVVVGYQQKKQTANAKSLNFKWWDFAAASRIRAFDARVDRLSHSKTGAHSLDVVIGCQDGTLHRYSDIFNKLIEVEKSQSTTGPLNAILHWHRDAVRAVKWSKDGNYLISGGGETVLVLWQLDTGGKNFLPHLTSPIESIVVSPSGVSYAIRLADNSTMVISTQELKPTVNIPGLVLPSTVHAENKAALFAGATLRKELVSRRPAIAMSKSQPAQMLLAVPAVASFSKDPTASRSAAYLQTIDARSGTHIARQALTRTKITDRNMGPDGFTIDEPNVVLLQVSSDGKWLATVEEWYPPSRDLDPLDINEEELARSRSQCLETSLRFWAWNAESSVWELVNRVDKPHLASNDLQDAGGIILDLVPDPSSAGFVTLGEDCAAKTWKPRTRYRNNIPIKDEQGQTLVNWSCRQIIRLPHASPESDILQGPSRIAMSQDGSILVAGRSSLSGSVICLVDMRSSEITSIRTDMFTGLLKDMAVLGQYFIILAEQLVVWDLVDARLAWALELDSSSMAQGSHPRHLAINSESAMFAIAQRGENKKGRPRTRIAIFDPATSIPLHVTESRQALLALVSAWQQKGFYAVDRAAQILAFTPALQVEVSKEMEPTAEDGEAEEMPAATGLDAIFGKKLKKEGEDASKESQAADESLVSAGDRDLNHVRQHQLNQLFAYTQPFALPPVASLFEQVAELIAGVKVE